MLADTTGKAVQRGEFFYPSRARGAVLAGVGTACCALAGPRRNLRFVKSEWLRRRGLSLLIPGDAAGFSVVCTIDPWLLRAHRMPFSGERTTCEPSFAHPTMQSPQKSLAPDEPKYLLSRARRDKYPSAPRHPRVASEDVKREYFPRINVQIVIRSTSSSMISSPVRSQSFVVRGLSCAAMAWAFPSVPPASR
jgi:hypothetical protein